MKKITITNAYTWHNKGDAGILLGIISTLKKEFMNEKLEINILSFTPNIDSENYCKDDCIKNVYSNILNPHPYKHTKFGKLIAIVKLFFRMIYLYFGSKVFLKYLVYKEKSLKILSESDFIVVCGGGFLGGNKLDSFIHLYQLYMNTLFNKKVIMMGTSIEPMRNNLIKKYTEKVLLKIDYIYAREKITYNYLKSFMCQDKICLIPDMAFILEKKDYEPVLIKHLKAKQNILFGITVRKWNFPNLSNTKVAMYNYKKSIVDTMIFFINKNNAYFIFIPQVIVSTGNDIVVAKEIKEMLPKEYQRNFIIFDDDISPQEIKGLISNCNYFIGTRMHSNIFATSLYIPTVAIAYEQKTIGIMDTIGLSDYVININDIKGDKLINKVNKLIKNSNKVRKMLQQNIPIIQQNIMKKVDEGIKKMEV